MNGDAFKRVRQGDAMEIQAAAWNACLDAAEATKRGGGGVVDAVGRQFRQADIVLVKNSSGSDVSRFHVLGISGVIFTPTDSLPSFQNQVAFTGVTPTTASHAGKFLVCLDALKNGQIGRAWIAGVAQVQVNIVSTADRFCDVKNSDRTQLQSMGSGAARILWQESGAGTKWCAVRIGDGGQPVRLGKTTATWTKGTSTTIDIYESGSAGSETISSGTVTAWNKFATVASGKWVSLARGPFDAWYLIAAEC
jgi:hypothetical protein